MKKVYICSKCGKLIITDNLTERFCSTDGGTIMDSGYTEEAWNALTDDVRAKTIQSAKDAGKKEEFNKTMSNTGAAISSGAKKAGDGIKSAYEKSSLLYNNVGDKIRTLAKVVAWIGIILSCIGGIAVMFGAGSYFGANFGTFISGLLMAVIGSLASWIGSLALYGFGELIVTTKQIAENTKK